MIASDQVNRGGGKATASSSPIVFVVDDDDSVRRALGRLVSAAGWSAEGFSSAGAFLDRLPYDGVGCILLDVEMPGMNGPLLQKELRDRGIALPIIYLTGHADVPISVDAMKNGALDVLQKPADDTSVLQTVGAALERHALMHASQIEKSQIGGRMARLTPREREVLAFVIKGRLNKQIAGDLGITEKTVKAHRARVMQKLEVRSVANLVRMCMKVDFVPDATQP